MKTLKDRWGSKTPTFWKKVQRVGLVAGALGAAIIAAPVALPAALVTASGYLVAVGGVTAALSQLTVDDKKESED
jgi:ABC-type xylose transport system permease subunit